MTTPTQDISNSAHTHSNNPFAIAQEQFDEASSRLGLSREVHDLLRYPQHEAHMRFPVDMDDGSVHVFQGFRVQYNSARGPAKGGLRWHPQETIDTVRALAAWMTWKTALLDLPLGGGKGGVICNPKELSHNEKERLARAFMRNLARHVGSRLDVPAPDVYTTPQIMAWMMDEYEVIRGHRDPGVITGKPLSIGGSLGRDDATGRGAVYCVQAALDVRPVASSALSFAIQGFGNAGQAVALLHPEILGNGKLLAVSDSSGGIFNSNGLDPAKLVEFKMEHGTLAGYPEGEPISNGDLLELEVDVLYPAALENAIHADNAAKIKAKVIAEVANGPTTPEGDQILHEKEVILLPDFLANAGGVTVSYFEQVQNQANHYWDLPTVHERLRSRMVSSFKNVEHRLLQEGVHWRLAAYMVAVERVAAACQARGWVKKIRA